MSRTSLETQKLDLMDEVSYLKLKLVGMEENTANGTPPQSGSLESGDAKPNKAEVGLHCYVFNKAIILRGSSLHTKFY